MPSRPHVSAAEAPLHQIIKARIQGHHPFSSLLVGLAAGGAITVAFTFFFILALLYRKLLKTKKTSPLDLGIRRFSYRELKLATASFGEDHKLGHGGFGSVYRGRLRINGSETEVAVKVLDPGSLQGEREFQNEVSVMAKLGCSSPYVVGLLGFCQDTKRKRKMLVYEYMPNRSLQEALFGDGKNPRLLLGWKTRFKIITDTARALAFLHSKCDPVIIHGDVKPSNILLDSNMSAKIADFGLSRLQERAEEAVGRLDIEEETEKDEEEEEDVELQNEGTLVDGSESVFDEEKSAKSRQVFSPESLIGDKSVPENPNLKDDIDNGTEITEKGAKDQFTDAKSTQNTDYSESDVTSLDGSAILMMPGNENHKNKTKKKKSPKSGSEREWWWKQDCNSGELGLKDYVMEWIGSEIRKENEPNVNLSKILESSPNPSLKNPKKTASQRRRSLEWWTSLSSEGGESKAKLGSKTRKNHRTSREWWREEYCEELCNKNKAKKKAHSRSLSMEWWRSDMEEEKKQRKNNLRNKSTTSSRHSRDFWSGDLLGSTPSMRGTVCYVAPEYGGGGIVSEKGDVYSFGVVILVTVAGRRPLQMTASPITELERANLISWARHLARSGNVLELVDPCLNEAVPDFDREEAILCITIALLCLQRLPAGRPSMSDVVNMLSGEMEVPSLPLEFSPSPPYAIPFVSRMKSSASQKRS
eukprot:TRINITY_DN1838_c0_g1_i1.p1 TRINITY_DN1838_c0_g1~~TRINITY_DN1838_c0_g1_i1.p1  ORF type:complete len:701 (-),score=92.79 TRINITY_DN1838_c0_g1_i1:120-2222(-)